MDNFITSESIARALAKLYPHENFDEFYQQPKCKSHSSNATIWRDVCFEIVKAKGKRTIKKYTRRCYDLFRKNVVAIKL